MAKRHATKMGIMGAIVGGLNFAQRQWETQQAEEAEMRKQARLEQILIAREGRAETRDTAKELRGYAHDDAKQLSSQEHEVALTALQNELGITRDQARAELESRQQAARMAHDSSENAADRAFRGSEGQKDRETQLEVAKQRGDAGDSILGDDGKWYPKGTALPAGVKPYAGAGISFAPSASKSGGLPAGRKPGMPGAAPAAPRDYTGFSINPDQ